MRAEKGSGCEHCPVTGAEEKSACPDDEHCVLHRDSAAFLHCLPVTMQGKSSIASTGTSYGTGRQLCWAIPGVLRWDLAGRDTASITTANMEQMVTAVTAWSSGQAPWLLNLAGETPRSGVQEGSFPEPPRGSAPAEVQRF